MQSSVFVAVIVALGQLGGTDLRYGELENQPAPPAEAEHVPPANDNWDYPPIKPADSAAGAPTAAASPTQPPAAALPVEIAPAEVKPADLWASLAALPVKDQLPGLPLSLASAVHGATTRSGQTDHITAYWELAAALADYSLAVRESVELETLRQGVARPSIAWDEARLAQAARIATAKAEAEAAQYRMQRIAGKIGAQLPLLADSPHAGAYETRYEENFAGRDSAEALLLTELLPKLHQELRSEATAIAADSQVLQSVSQQRDPQSDGIALLRTYDLLSLRRREFIRAVIDYNIQIARYSELATPGQVGTNRLVAMLIESPHTLSAAEFDSGVTRTSAEEPVESAPRGSTPRTFQEEQPAVTERKPALQEGQERSILVQP